MERFPLREFVIDTSVIAKWFFEENDTIFALKVRDAYIKGHFELFAPDLVFFVFTTIGPYYNSLTPNSNPFSALNPHLRFLSADLSM